MNLVTKLDYMGHQLSLEIENLPASEQQTKVSIICGEFREEVQKMENSFSCKGCIAENNPYVEGRRMCRRCKRTAYDHFERK